MSKYAEVEFQGNNLWRNWRCICMELKKKVKHLKKCIYNSNLKCWHFIPDRLECFDQWRKELNSTKQCTGETQSTYNRRVTSDLVPERNTNNRLSRSLQENCFSSERSDPDDCTETLLIYGAWVMKLQRSSALLRGSGERKKISPFHINLHHLWIYSSNSERNSGAEADDVLVL